jgi:hypothetical protein
VILKPYQKKAWWSAIRVKGYEFRTGVSTEARSFQNVSLSL